MTTRIPCPTCGRPKPEFAIRNGRCRDDIMDEERKEAAVAHKRTQQEKRQSRER